MTTFSAEHAAFSGVGVNASDSASEAASLFSLGERTGMERKSIGRFAFLTPWEGPGDGDLDLASGRNLSYGFAVGV